jgi:cysteine desulfurase
MDLAYQNLERKNTKIKALRDQLINGIYKRIPFCRLNGHREQRLPNNVNFSFDFIEGESLLLLLDFEGIAASSGSACTSGSLDPSHVLLALGLPHEQAHGSIRFTLGEDNTREEVDLLLEKLPPFVQKLRAMSPLYEDFLRKHS